MNNSATRIIELKTGSLQLEITHNDHDWKFDQLLDIAERKNPNRAFLFVSKVLGRHIPQSPTVIRKAFTDLAMQIPDYLEGPVTMIGMAETAVGLAAGVHQVYTEQSASLLLTTTRHPLDASICCEFKEEHSHAATHYLHLPQDEALRQHLLSTKTLILIDDEMTTGKTFFNIYQSLVSAGLASIEQIIIVTLADWTNNQIHQHLDLITHNISLLHGKWQWQAKENIDYFEVPKLANSVQSLQPLNRFKGSWGRLGFIDSPALQLHAKPAKAKEKILVLGSGEYVWQPFLLAESLEKQGAEVLFSSITRSPITVGNAIACAMSFHDNYGVNVPMYVYNVDSSDYDRVILCSETPRSSWDASFLSQIKNLEFIE